MLFAPISKFEVEIARKEFVLLRKMIRGLLDDQPVGRRLPDRHPVAHEFQQEPCILPPD